MKKSIKINEESIEYTIKKSKRAKRLRLTIYCDTNIVITAPIRMAENFIEKFIKDKWPWIIKKINFFKEKRENLEIKGGYKDNKKKVEEFIKSRIEHYNRFYNFSYNKILAKNHNHRWGSCSIKGNLNFNYRILFLPPQLADYITVHELCHLKEMNHSRRFWALVEETIPDYKERVRELRKIVY
ncbi:MAG: M48 family metallopeptidase [bacterium]